MRQTKPPTTYVAASVIVTVRAMMKKLKRETIMKTKISNTLDWDSDDISFVFFAGMAFLSGAIGSYYSSRPLGFGVFGVGLLIAAIVISILKYLDGRNTYASDSLVCPPCSQREGCCPQCVGGQEGTNPCLCVCHVRKPTKSAEN